MRQQPPPYHTYMVIGNDRMRQLEIARNRNYTNEFERAKRKAQLEGKVARLDKNIHASTHLETHNNIRIV